ncbi:hypothetical protein HY798_00515 [Candidatus Falkowbacteria bacterium]|nr:hypothetical protein [Candidatus Falkowbacteria bacterium]
MTIVYSHKYLKPIRRLLRKQEISAERRRSVFCHSRPSSELVEERG